MPDVIAASVGGSQVVDALQYDHAAGQVIAVGATAVSSSAFVVPYTVLLLTSTTNCWYSLGTAAAHTVGSDYLPANMKLKLKIPAGALISVIQDSAGGYLSIVPMANPQLGAIPGPAFDWDFTSGSLPTGMTLTRSTTANYFNSSGLLVSAAINTARFDYDPVTLRPRGLLTEPNTNNICLWNRDLTNAVWVKTSATAALTQTGIDGVANSCSAITASAANGTVLQSFTGASALRTLSGYVKRLVGTGTVNVTQDGGATWTPITVTSGWTRFVNNVQTLTNPNIGFQLVTNGDSIAVDAVQLEPVIAYSTSPILTTTAIVNRAADAYILTPTSWFNASAGTLLGYLDAGTVPASVSARFMQLDDGTNNNRFVVRHWNTLDAFVSVATVNTWTEANTIPYPPGPQVFKNAVAYQTGAPMVHAAAGIVAYGSGSNVTAQPTGINRLSFAGVSWVRRVTYWNARLPDAQLAAVTT